MVGAEIEGYVNTFTDLCHMQAARAAGEVSRICSEILYGCADAANPASAEAAEFQSLQAALNASMAGARLSKDRAAKALSQIMIPEALDYPQ